MKTKLLTFMLVLLTTMSYVLAQNYLIEDLIFTGNTVSPTLRYGYLKLSGESLIGLRSDLDSVYNYAVNDGTMNLHNADFYTFDGQGRITRREGRWLENSGNSWRLNDWYDYSYDGAGSLISHKVKLADEPYVLEGNYEYNENGECSGITSVQYFESGSELIFRSRKFEYNDNNFMIKDTFWDHDVLQSKREISYDNQKCSKIVYYSYENEQWKRGGTTQFTYNDDGLLSLIEYESSLRNEKSAYVYDTSGNVVNTVQFNYSSGWELSDSAFYEYNEKSQLINEERYNKLENSTDWSGVAKHEYSYDDEGRLSEHDQYVMWAGTTWNKNMVSKYFYSEKVVSSITNKSGSEFIIYPNPSTGNIYVTGNANMEKIVSVFDANGKIIYEYSFDGNETMLGKTFYPGIYWMRISSQGESEFQKFVVY